MTDVVRVACQECAVGLAGDSTDLRLELTCNDEPVAYCAGFWTREFGESAA